MTRKILSGVFLTAISVALLTASPAEARKRFFWWEQDQSYDVSRYDSYESSNFYDDEDFAEDEEFNQAQYDLLMRELRQKRRLRTVERYYEPQFDEPIYTKPLPKKAKKKTVVKVAVKKPAVKALPPSDKSIQTASLSKPIEIKKAVVKIDCKKGAAIVSGYGFSTVTTKSCTGATLVYGASRSGKNFEIQVSSASGELTTVKKL